MSSCSACPECEYVCSEYCPLIGEGLDSFNAKQEKEKPISLDAYRETGKITTRTIVADTEYLNARFHAYCPVCQETRLHDPLGEDQRKCCNCDFRHRETDLGTLTWVHYVGEKARWVKW